MAFDGHGCWVLGAPENVLRDGFAGMRGAGVTAGAGLTGGDGQPGSEILFAIRQTWENYEAWEAEFKKTGNALAGGSGWVTLGFNFHTGELHNYWSWDHQHNPPFSRPLLVMDMYEHSYHMDYGSAAAKYVDAFMQNVNWEEVKRRYLRTKKAAEALKA